ncbi:MAG: zinc ribbon domain-containing protein [Caulobacter sp.]|nr:zinc ribbon domain-containing protein [Caulobacter sp.]
MILHPPLPVADDLSQAFWEGVNERRLLVQRCAACRRFQFPPDASCASCSSTELSFEEVSGRGAVFSFTETVSGARHPYFQSISPYLVGLVQLEEQEGLIFASNFPGSEYADLEIGAPVDVEFQEIAEGAVIPQFRLRTVRLAER